MRISPNDACPLGAHLQHYWDRLSDKEKNMEPDGRKLLNLAFSISESVVMRLPKNFELSELGSIGRDYVLEENMLAGRLLHYCVYFK